MARISARVVLLLLLAGSLGFVGYVARSDRFPMRDVVVPVTGKQYRVYDAPGFTAFVAVDSTRRTEGAEGTTVPVAVPVPEGVKYQTTVPEKAEN